MVYSIATLYLFMKIAFLFALVRAQVMYEPLKKHLLFLAVLYTAGVAFLSYIFLVSIGALNWAPWQVRIAASLGVSPWLSWVGQTFLLSALYFWLLARFEEGFLFWVLIPVGILLALY